jgi:predicted Zn-dependent peptidase
VNLGVHATEQPPRRTEFSGGAVLLEVPVASAHAVSVGVFLRRASADEPPGVHGVSHFLEHMVFKGSERYSALDIAEGLDAIGAVIDAFTSKNYVVFSLKVLPEYLDRAVDILADMLLRPALEPQTIALEQDVVCEEIQEALDTPEDRLHDAFAAHVYGAHWRGRPILGTPETVRGFDTEVLRREHRRLFDPANVVVGLGGAFTPAHRERVLAAFSGLGGGPPIADEESPAAAPDATARQGSELVIESSILQTYFEIGNLAVGHRHPDRVPVLLLSNLLGGGMSSRIFQAVREREGLAYTVYTYTDMGPDTGLVSCAGSCTPDKEPRLRELVRQEYARLLREGPTEAELEANKAQFKSQLVFALEAAYNRMFRAAKNELYHGRFVPLTETVARIDAVDRDAIVRCAREWFDPDRLVLATHRPSQRRQDAGAAMAER